MIFNEIYGVYYNTMTQILRRAVTGNIICMEDIRKIINEQAFSESSLIIESAINNENWHLIKKDGTTPIKHQPDFPLTKLEKRWLKAISLDPRVKLFDCVFEGLDDVDPLFTSNDYFIFDKYTNGDDFENEKYIKNFRFILEAVKSQTPINIDIVNQKGTQLSYCVIPKLLEYSEKDDKFRLITVGNSTAKIINLSNVLNCSLCNEPYIFEIMPKPKKPCYVLFELLDEKNSLERVMLHFSHFQKQTEKLDVNHYIIKVIYDKNDETELVIRILSFGSKIKVISPDSFVDLIKQRLRKQKRCKLI